MLKKAIVFMLFITFAAVSCKKSVESEQRAWQSNLKKATELSYEFPSFSNVIKDQITAAQNVMNSASSISDETAKIQKMAEANAQLRPRFVSNLDEIRSLKQSIRTKASEVRNLKTPVNDMMMTGQVISDSERLISDCDMRLRSSVNSRMDADSLTSIVINDLHNMESNMERIISNAKQKDDADKKNSAVSADKSGSGKGKTEVAMIKCRYCGQMTPATASVCKYCGAPVKK